MYYSDDTNTYFDYMFNKQSETCMLQDVESALKAAIITAANEDKSYTFDRLLSTYACIWAESNKQAEEQKDHDAMVDSDLYGWDETSNEAQTDPEISALRRDLNFLARHLCVTLPSM